MDEDESVFTESLPPSDDPSSREAGALNDGGEEEAEESSFCGSTFSLYAPWVRGLYTLSCALIVATTFAHSYAYYFARDHPLLLASLHLSHLVYAVVVLFRLRTSYIESGLEETGRAAVARRYHRSPAMLADIVSFLPTGEIAWLASPHRSSPAWWRHQRWTPLIYLRVHFVMGYLMEREREPGSRTIKYRTLRYSIVVCLALHLITCWWFGLACAPDFATVALRFRLVCSRSSWLGGFQSRVEQRFLALTAAANATTGDAIVTSARVNASGYASSLYWATATLTSTGYGDVRASSETEKMFSVGAMLTSIIIVFGTVLGGMTSMLSHLDAKRSGFAHRRAAFYHEVARMEVSGEARDICLGYLEYAWRRWRGSSVHTDGTLRALPEALRAKFCEAAFAPFVGEVDLLRGLGEDFLRNLTLIVEMSVFVDGQYVQRSGEIGDALCYVHRGVLEVLEGRDERATVALLHAGKAFGQIHLVYDLPRTSSVRCKVDSTLFLIRRHRFRQLLSDYPREARLFWQRVSDKGSGQRARWPLHPPPLLHFLSHLTKMRASDRRASIMPGAHVTAAPVHQSATSKQDEALLQVRRKSTVSSSRYEGARLVRVDLGGHDAPLGGGLQPHDSTLSYINLLHRNTLGESGDEHGTKRTARRSSVPIGDHIEIFSDFNQRESLQADESAKSDSAYDRFLAMTAVDPQGGFLRAWRIFMAATTMFAFVHVTFVAFFMTSPAPGVTLKNDEVRRVDVYRIAVDSACDVTSATIYEEKCGGERDDFDRLVVCLIGTGRHINFLLSRRELGRYELKIPSSYDVSSVAMTTATPAGRVNVALAYLLIDVVLWANVFVHFRISVVTPLNTFIDVRSASEAYTKLWGGFWLDLASLLPLEVITPLVSCSRYSRAVTWSFLRLNRAAAALRHVPVALADEERRRAGRVGLVRAVKFALYIYACTHLCACALYWSACGFVKLDSVEQRATKCEPGSWGWSYGIAWRTGKLSDYVKSVYWVTTTQTTTGYGDIVPSTTTERVLVIVTMLVGSVLYGWLVAVIACTVSNKLFERSVFQQKVLATEQYLAAQRVDRDLIARVVAVRRLEWKRYRGEASPGGEVIGSDLPQEMRDMLQCESVARYLRAVPFFRHASDSLVLGLCRHARTYLFNAGDVVCYEGDVQTDLYMVRRGHCSSLDRQMRYAGRDYDPRDYFGAVEVFLDAAAPATVVATTTCELIALSRQSIFGVLGDFPFYRDQLAAMARDREYREAALARARGGDRYDGDGTRSVGSMHDKFEVHSVNETLFFGSALRQLPFFIRTSTAGAGPLRSLLAKLLLPVTFDPRSDKYVAYEFACACFALVTVLVVPLQFAFLPSSFALMGIEYALAALGVANQFVRAHTMYHDDEGLPVSHPSRTALKYVKSVGFLMDLITWFPFELIVLASMSSGSLSHQQLKFVALFRCLRLVSLYKIVRFFDYHFAEISVQRTWLKYLSYSVYSLIIHHWFACILFSFACPPQFGPHDPTAGDHIRLNSSASATYCEAGSWFAAALQSHPTLGLDTSVFAQYAVSLYWATSTLIGVGYGDIHARTLKEQVAAAVAMLAGHVYYSCVLGELSAGMQSADIRRAEYTSKLGHIARFLRVYRVGAEKSRRVTEYYHYLWQRTRGVSPDQLLANLPPALRTTVCQSMYSDNISLCLEGLRHGESGGGGVVSGDERRSFHRLLSSFVKPMICMERSVIFREGDVGEEMYFIERGAVEVMDIDNRRPITTLTAGDYFGDEALLYDKPRNRTVVARSLCELYFIGKDDLKSLLRQFPDFHESLIQGVKIRRERLRREEEDHAASDTLNLEERLLFGVQKTTNFMTSESTLDHTSSFVVYFKILTVILAFFSVNLTVYQALFLSHSRVIYTIGFVIDLWFLCEMMVTFHTSYYDEQSAVVDDISKIRHRYYSDPSLFLLDLVSNCPIDLLLHFLPQLDPTTKFNLFAGLRFNRVLRFCRVVWYFQEWEADTRYRMLRVRMCKFALYLGFIINLAASLWYFYSCKQNRCARDSWTTIEGVTDYGENEIFSHSLRAWVDSVYWATATMTATGYGDIHPQNKGEMLLSCCVMLLGKVAVGYVLGIVAATLANDESLHATYEERVSAVKGCMSEHEFDADLSARVVRHFDFTWSRHRGVDLMRLFADLPFSIRADIHQEVCGELVNRIDVFRGCPTNFVRHLCLVTTPFSFNPGDFIALQGDCRSELCVVQSGQVNEIRRSTDGSPDRIERVLGPGDAYMTTSVLFKSTRPTSLQAKTPAEVFTVTMDDLKKVLSAHPDAVLQTILANARRLQEDEGYNLLQAED